MSNSYRSVHPMQNGIQFQRLLQRRRLLRLLPATEQVGVDFIRAELEEAERFAWRHLAELSVVLAGVFFVRGAGNQRAGWDRNLAGASWRTQSRCWTGSERRSLGSSSGRTWEWRALSSCGTARSSASNGAALRTVLTRGVRQRRAWCTAMVWSVNQLKVIDFDPSLSMERPWVPNQRSRSPYSSQNEPMTDDFIKMIHSGWLQVGGLYIVPVVAVHRLWDGVPCFSHSGSVQGF